MPRAEEFEESSFMSRKALVIVVLAVCSVLSAAVLFARGGNLYAWVEGVNRDREDAAYNIKPAEPVDVGAGEEVQVTLWVGTVSDDDTKVGASFSVVAGRENIQITGSGNGWVRVRAKGGSGGIGQIGYEVDGDYGLPGGLRSGRITFEIE
jgi:hypothetical protein